MENRLSNTWSSETLVRGMASAAAQPFGLLSLDEMDEDLRKQAMEPRCNNTGVVKSKYQPLFVEYIGNTRGMVPELVDPLSMLI